MSEKSRLDFRKKKNGNIIIDLITLSVTIMVLGLGLMIFYGIQGDIDSVVLDNDNINEDAKAIVEDSQETYASQWDQGIMALFFAMWLTILVGSFFINSHPLLFVVFLIAFFVFLIALVSVINIIYETSLETAQEGRENFPITTFIIDNMLWIILVVGFSSMVVMFSKLR